MKLQALRNRLILLSAAISMFVVKSVSSVLLYNNTTWGGGWTDSSDNITLIPQTLYENVTGYMGGNVTNANITTSLPNFGMIVYDGLQYYILSMGQVGMLLLFAIPFISMWIINGNMTLVGIVGMLFSLFLFLKIGDAYAAFCVAAMIISFTSIIYGILKR